MIISLIHEQGRIHGTTVADGWAGAVMQKPLAIQDYDGPTDRHGKVSATKNDEVVIRLGGIRL